MRGVVLLVLIAACGRAKPPPAALSPRESMARRIAERGVKDARVLAAMRKVPRAEFVPARWRAQAYEDRKLPIGEGQTISEPYIVAILAELAEIGPEDRVLEIGTGSGYGAAVLAELGAAVYTIEILEPLALQAAATLERLGYRTVRVRHGDGYNGWAEAAPFDAIVVTAAPPQIPQPLKDQLEEGGKLVAPVGGQVQRLRVLTRVEESVEEKVHFRVHEVPMTGRIQED